MLIGDAAHSMSPNLGCGATAGMADATLLATTAAALHASAGTPTGDITSSGSSLAASHALMHAPHAFERLADEWTRERLHDAHAYTLVSKGVSDLTWFKYHEDFWRLLKALPVALPRILLPKMRFPGKGVILEFENICLLLHNLA